MAQSAVAYLVYYYCDTFLSLISALSAVFNKHSHTCM